MHRAAFLWRKRSFHLSGWLAYHFFWQSEWWLLWLQRRLWWTRWIWNTDDTAKFVQRINTDLSKMTPNLYALTKFTGFICGPCDLCVVKTQQFHSATLCTNNTLALDVLNIQHYFIWFIFFSSLRNQHWCSNCKCFHVFSWFSQFLWISTSFFFLKKLQTKCYLKVTFYQKSKICLPASSRSRNSALPQWLLH